MKKRKQIMLLLLSLNFLLIVFNMAELFHEGCLRDAFPQAEINETVSNFFWVSLPLTFLLFTIGIVLFITNKYKHVLNGIAFVFIPILFLCNIYFGHMYYETYKPYGLSFEYGDDYISSEYIRGIELEELKLSLQAEDSTLIYVGREDCKECADFEEVFEPLLEQYSTEIQAYYTNLDRDGNRSKEMYELLDAYQIDSVPTVVAIENAELIKKWDNPIDNMWEIEEEYFK